jgi:hypothetical protein
MRYKRLKILFPNIENRKCQYFGRNLKPHRTRNDTFAKIIMKKMRKCNLKARNLAQSKDNNIFFEIGNTNQIRDSSQF